MCWKVSWKARSPICSSLLMVQHGYLLLFDCIVTLNHSAVMVLGGGGRTVLGTEPKFSWRARQKLALLPYISRPLGKTQNVDEDRHWVNCLRTSKSGFRVPHSPHNAILPLPAWGLVSLIRLPYFKFSSVCLCFGTCVHLPLEASHVSR